MGNEEVSQINFNNKSLTSNQAIERHNHNNHNHNNDRHHQHEDIYENKTTNHDNEKRKGILLDHLSHHVNSNTASIGLLYLLDGIGLTVIAASTISEGIDLWNDFFSEYWISNSSSLAFWFSGRTCQIIGLFVLIAHAASFQIFHEVESYGMFMLTLGPILNIFACSLFDSGIDQAYLYNKKWLSTEIIEIVGIIVLDISLIDMTESVVLLFEITGFLILCCAAGIEVEYNENGEYPVIDFRLDIIHCSECCGLIMLILVAIGQYKIKLLKHQEGYKHHQLHVVRKEEIQDSHNYENYENYQHVSSQLQKDTMNYRNNLHIV